MIVRFPSRSGLRIGKDTPDFLWGDRGGIHIVSIRTGKGRITALSSLPFTNRSIEAHDHAGLLYHLVRWDGRAGVVRFFDRSERLSIWQWSVERAPYFLIALGVLIGLWLWRTAARFGPIAPDPLPERRRLLDHLVANGRFQWRNGGAVELINAAREQAFVQIRRVSPGFDALDRSRQLARLQQLVAFSKEEARATLRDSPRSPTELLEQVRLFQRIHATLARRPIEQHQEAIV